jgi:hypothetical protein
MRVFTNLLFKVTLSSMIVTAPSMINGSKNDAGAWGKELNMSYYSTAVIKKFVDHSVLTAAPLFAEDGIRTGKLANATDGMRAGKMVSPEIVKMPDMSANAVDGGKAGKAIVAANGIKSVKTVSPEGATPAAGAVYPEDGERSEKRTFSESKSAEVKMVINEAVILYANMSLEKSGLDEKAFEYAWRGYHNLLKKKLIRKTSVLSICDFSQSCCSKRMYVIDVRHQKLLYRTYVAHGQNSGAEYATSFSNEPDSYKSSLGFYITKKTYFGRNGLSLRIDGVDSGYNDMAGKRNIVLHGSSYATDRYMSNNGTLGTSLGCPAIPSAVSPRIIRTVKNGSCLFIYAPASNYLENSAIINGNG